MKAGDVFRLAGVAEVHTWAIISDPRVNPHRVLLVNFTSWDPREDQACILDVGDHPFLTHRTCVNYPRAREAADADLEQLRRAGRLVMLEAIAPNVLRRIREGAMVSTRMKLELAELLVEQELVD